MLPNQTLTASRLFETGQVSYLTITCQSSDFVGIERRIWAFAEGERTSKYSSRALRA